MGFRSTSRTHFDRMVGLVRVNEFEPIIRSSPPDLPEDLPKEPWRGSESLGTSYRRLQPTFFRFQRRAASSCVSCRYRICYLARAFRSPMECPVSRRAHPASAGSRLRRRALSSRASLPRTVPLTPRHFADQRASSSSAVGSVELASAAPPCRRAACPEQGRLPLARPSKRRATPNPNHAF
jgi:hypothetical protein